MAVFLTAICLLTFISCSPDSPNPRQQDAGKEEEWREISGQVTAEDFGGEPMVIIGVEVMIFERESITRHFATRRGQAKLSVPTFQKALAGIDEDLEKAVPIAQQSAFFGNRQGLRCVEYLKALRAQVERVPPSWPTSAFLFGELPAPKFRSESDSDGNFQIRFRGVEDPVLVAAYREPGLVPFNFPNFSVQEIPGLLAEYWAVALGEGDLAQGRVNLSPRNSTRSSDSRSLVRTEIADCVMPPDVVGSSP